ncbi:alcohol dehydrogenase, propanol-preferring [Micromonospora cremea]|uniref:alcohol dehydrogenase n=2 Tax=Micromonospora cremea TaxID=709881 RepID=A0A1N5TW60_9ACTN|nr:alcohol dehydrogenase, propanol-preferring [Micromonospora cremea]
MKAWQFIGVGSPLTLRDVDVPEAGPGQVLIDVKASGLCHSDIGYLEGTITHLPFAPITLGHEMSGVIAQVGAGVTGFKIGQRVAIPSTLETPGNASDGGFAEYVVARQEHILGIPDDVDFVHAALAMDAGMTSYHAVRYGGTKQGTRIGIIGLGGLGFLGAQFALALGAEVYGVEINEDVWPRALDVGVADVARSIGEFADKNLEVIIDFAGFGTTTAEAFEAIGHGGTVVQVGLGRSTATISTWALLSKELRYLGSAGGTFDDVRAVLDLFSRNKVKPLLSTVSFEQIGEAIGRLERGRVDGRIVAVQH